MNYTISEVQQITKTEAVLNGDICVLDTIGFDTRRLGNANTTLFFCLKGKTQSGDKYVGEAHKLGVRNFVVNDGFEISNFPNSNFIFSKDVLRTLQNLAIYHRDLFTGPVIGITGSNGKTIVKEWLFTLLKNDFIVAKSPRSYNSSLGVAISLMGIESQHNMAIIEAGISSPGDMKDLQEMIKPSLGIITHLGAAHDEKFESRKQKAQEKIKLFLDADVVVYPYDSIEIREALSELRTKKPLIQTYSWGFQEGAKFRLISVESEHSKSILKFIHRATEHQLEIPFIDDAAVENAMTCLCTLAAFERWDEAHIKAFESLPALENRLAFYEGKNGNYIVNDSYSNDLDSLQVALDFMLRQQPGMSPIAILSDLEQSDPNKELLYKKVADLLFKKGISELIAIGPEIKKQSTAFYEVETNYFPNVDSLLSSNILDKLQNRAVLIKGARHFKLERVALPLRKQMHQTVLEIDLNALRNNYSYFKSILNTNVKIMAMVKAFGYGSGSFEAAKTLQFMGADYLAVAFADEGVALRNAGISIPIMVMNCNADDLMTITEYNLEPVIFNREGLELFSAPGLMLKVHIEIDTGMHRLGFNSETIEVDFENFPNNLKIASVFSHLSASESKEHDEFTNLQIQQFIFVCTNIEKLTDQKFIKHIANTGGILRFPGAHLDMVRLGIGLYGADPTGAKNENLEVVASLKTNISQIRNVQAGESVGYSRKSIELKDRVIATLPIGYADGLRRKLGNENGYAMINGKRAAFVGNICMDMCMCDVTNITCKEGDQVEIFGKNVAVETVAEKCETIPYEILTSISHRVRREYVGEN